MRISDWSSYVCSSDLNLSEMPLQAIHRSLSSQPCGDVQLKVPPNGGRIENGQQKFLARLYGKGKSGKNGISAGWDRILLSMLVGPATPTGSLSGRTPTDRKRAV